MASVEALLEQWHTSRDPTLAQEIEAADAQRWARRFATTKRAPIRTAARQLERLPNDDPRVTSFLLECLQKARWAGPTAKSVWELIFHKLVVLGDVRALPSLRAALMNLPPILGAANAGWLTETLGRTVAALEAKGLREPAPNQVVAAKPTPHHALELVQRVFDNPFDDDVRRVVADALLEINDPWGELISTQLANGGTSAATEKLIRQNIDRIAGPIAPIGMKKYFQFEKGFLTTCNLGNSAPRPKWEAALGAPHWATVRQIDVGYGSPGWWLTEFAQRHFEKSLECLELFGSLYLRRNPKTGSLAITLFDQTGPVPADAEIPQRRSVTFLRQIAQGLPASTRASLIRESRHASIKRALLGEPEPP